MIDELFKFIKHPTTNVVDLSAGGVGVAAYLQMLPSISVGLTIVWMGLRIYILIRDQIMNRKNDGDE